MTFNITHIHSARVHHPEGTRRATGGQPEGNRRATATGGHWPTTARSLTITNVTHINNRQSAERTTPNAQARTYRTGRSDVSATHGHFTGLK